MTVMDMIEQLKEKGVIVRSNFDLGEILRSYGFAVDKQGSIISDYSNLQDVSHSQYSMDLLNPLNGKDNAVQALNARLSAMSEEDVNYLGNAPFGNEGSRGRQLTGPNLLNGGQFYDDPYFDLYGDESYSNDPYFDEYKAYEYSQGLHSKELHKLEELNDQQLLEELLLSKALLEDAINYDVYYLNQLGYDETRHDVGESSFHSGKVTTALSMKHRLSLQIVRFHHAYIWPSFLSIPQQLPAYNAPMIGLQHKGSNSSHLQMLLRFCCNIAGKIFGYKYLDEMYPKEGDANIDDKSDDSVHKTNDYYQPSKNIQDEKRFDEEMESTEFEKAQQKASSSPFSNIEIDSKIKISVDKLEYKSQSKENNQVKKLPDKNKEWAKNFHIKQDKLLQLLFQPHSMFSSVWTPQQAYDTAIMYMHQRYNQSVFLSKAQESHRKDQEDRGKYLTGRNVDRGHVSSVYFETEMDPRTRQSYVVPSLALYLWSYHDSYNYTIDNPIPWNYLYPQFQVQHLHLILGFQAM